MRAVLGGVVLIAGLGALAVTLVALASVSPPRNAAELVGLVAADIALLSCALFGLLLSVILVHLAHAAGADPGGDRRSVLPIIEETEVGALVPARTL